MENLDLSTLTAEEKKVLIDDATNEIKSLTSQMLNLSIKLSKTDSNLTNDIKSIKEIQNNVQDKLASNTKIIQMLKSGNDAAQVISNQIVLNNGSNVTAKKQVKIPTNVEHFDPNNDVSDVYLDNILSKSLSVGNDHPDHHCSVLLHYLPDSSKFESFVVNKMIGKDLTWAQMKELFVKEFDPRDNESKARDQLFSFDWSDGKDNVINASYKFQLIAKRAKIKLDDISWIQNFSTKGPIRLVTEFTRKYNINDFKTFEELEKALDEIEIAIKRIDELKQSKINQALISDSAASDDDPQQINANYTNFSKRNGSRFSGYSNSNNRTPPHYRNRSRSKSPNFSRYSNFSRSKSPHARHVRFDNYASDNNKSNKPCTFYFIDGYCKKADRCDMSHDRASLKDGNNMKQN